LHYGKGFSSLQAIALEHGNLKRDGLPLSDGRGGPSLQTQRRDPAQAQFSIQGPPLDTKTFPRVPLESVYGVIAG
jgi:hypothetical protein